jgi:hypothetical protein
MLLGFLSVALRKDYLLNKTVRGIALRLTQVSLLSRTTAVDYKVVLKENHYIVDVFDKDSEDWRRYLTRSYHKGVTCQPKNAEFIFSRGMLREFKLPQMHRKVPKYIVINFYWVNTSRKRGIIFYRKGDWRVLG